MKTILFLLLIILFVSGLYVYATDSLHLEEPFTGSADTSTTSCPDLLVQQGNVLALYNSKEPTSEKNPLMFESVDAYTTYAEAHPKCPVLYIRAENDIQGNPVYRVRPSPTDPQGGLPTEAPSPSPYIDASRDNAPFNQLSYPGFDPSSQYVGRYTVIDANHDSTAKDQVSVNPADPNWGGVQYTQFKIDSGEYDDYNVYPPRLVDAGRAGLII
jgi:hypothetical protein